MRCLLYYITDRKQFPGGEDSRRQRLLENIAEAARCGVDFIQLREKDLPSRELELLARQALGVIRSHRETGNQNLETRLLINSRSDVALAMGAGAAGIAGIRLFQENDIQSVVGALRYP